MGYTKIAGMPVINGLYTIVVPINAFALLGSPQAYLPGRRLHDRGDHVRWYLRGSVWPQPGSKQWVALAGVSALLAGAFLLLARVARLGFLANFLSRTVLVAFLTGVGIQVALGGQFVGRLGVASPSGTFNEFSGTIRKFVDTMKAAFRHVDRDAGRLGRRARGPRRVLEVDQAGAGWSRRGRRRDLAQLGI